MKKLVLMFAVFSYCLTALAASPVCSAIRQGKDRLACYDKTAKLSEESPPKSESSPVVASTMPNGVVFQSGAWSVHQKVEAMTDKQSCTALYKNEWTVQATLTQLYVSLRGRGGVSSYRIRIDSDPITDIQFATKMEKDISSLMLGGYYQKIYNSKRLRAEVLTVLNDVVVEDIDLTGLRDSLDFMREKCQ